MSKLLSMLMKSKGGGIEFKTSIYATGNAYIQTDISANADYKINIVGNVLVDTYTDQGSHYFFGANNPDQSPSYYLTGTLAFIGYNPNTSIPGIGLRSANNVAGYNAPYKQDINIGSSGGHISAPYHFTLSLSHTVAYDKNFRVLSDWQHADRKTNNMISIELIEIKDQNDNLIAELKPAIVNGESGMYDTVTETFYGNANSVGSLVCE